MLFRYDGQPEAFLRVLQPAVIRDVGVAHRAQCLQRGIRTAAGTAVQDDLCGFVRHDGGDLRPDPVVRNVPRALQIPAAYSSGERTSSRTAVFRSI